MEVDEKKTRPKSLWSHLYQQVEEQSDLCDVTVQVQTWKRKFHWCVLSASSFFVKLYESNFQERQTGLIKLNTGTPNAVQTAIHFLYGQRAKIDLDNAGDILEVAEFLMIAELKALCISKLKTIEVNLDNCLKILVLASRYGFYLENTEDFLMSHMQELLPNDEMLLLNKESVYFVLTDPMLSYVNQEDFFRFLIRWIGYCPIRLSDFPALFSCLDKDDLSADVLSTVSLDCLRESDKSLCYDLPVGSNRLRDVLIVYPPQYLSGKQRLLAYDLMNKSWSQIAVKDRSYWPSDKRVTLQDPNVIACLRNNGKEVGFYNLITQDEHKKNIEVHDSEGRYFFDHLAVAGNKYYCVQKITYYKGGASNDLEENKIELTDFLKMQALFAHNDILALQVLMASDRAKSRGRSNNASCLFVSEQEDDSTITVKPLMSVCGSVQSCCAVDGIVYLLIPEDNTLVVYAEEEGNVTRLDLSIFTLDKKTYICPRCKGGLYVVTKSHILQIDIEKQDSYIKASVSELLLPKEEETLDSWSRRNLPLYEVLKDIVITITRFKDVGKNQFWYQILPEKVNVLDKEEKFEINVPEQLNHENNIHFLQTTLSKEFLKCPLECPHCKEKDTTVRRYYGHTPDYDSDEYIYYNDSDDYFQSKIYFDDSSSDDYVYYDSDW